jgi:drug/metabolite transporter, DME family
LNRPLLVGSGLIVGAASLFGTLGFLSRSAAALGMGPLPFVFWRAGLGVLVLVVLGVALGFRHAGGGGRRDLGRFGRLTANRWLALVVAAFVGALLNVAIFAAFQRMAIAVALICFYTFPALVTLAAIPLYGDRLDGRRLLALVLSSAGLLLVLLAPAFGSSGGLVIDPLGVGLALFAALCQAAFVLIAGRGFDPLSSLDVSAIVISAALVVSGVLLAAIGDFASVVLPASEPRLWPWILLAGVTGAAIPTTAFLAGIGRIGPSRAAILMTFEPLVGVALAALLLGERPVPLQLAGGAAVLAAAVLLQTAHGRAPEEAEARVV